MKRKIIATWVCGLICIAAIISIVVCSVNANYAKEHYKNNYVKDSFLTYGYGCGDNECKYCNGGQYKKSLDDFVYLNSMNNGKTISNVLALLFGIATLALCIFDFQSPQDKEKEVGKESDAVCSPTTNYFADLFIRLSFFEIYGAHKYIDFIIFALFKTRLCAIMCVEESNMTDEEKKDVMDAYDTYMYLSLGIWMDENVPEFKAKAEIADIRMRAYDQTLLKFQNSPFAMSFVSNALYWFLQNGWTKNIDGTHSTTPCTNIDISVISKTDKELERQYARTFDEMDILILNYAQTNMPSLIKFLKDELK